MKSFAFFILSLAFPLFSNEEHLRALVAIENHLAQQKDQAMMENTPPALPPSEAPPQLQPTTTSFESAFVRMLLVLAGILIFVFVAFFLFKRFSSTRMQQSNHFRAIKILEKRAISPKSMLYLVEVGGEKVLFAESQLEIRQIIHLNEAVSDKKGL